MVAGFHNKFINGVTKSGGNWYPPGRGAESLTPLIVAFWRTLFVLFTMTMVGCVSVRERSRVEENAGIDQLTQSTASTQISPQLLIEDLRFIDDNLRKVHPNPFLRVTEQNYNELLDKTLSQLKIGQTRGEFYLKVAPLLASLRDAHSFVHLPKDRRGEFRRRGEMLFPLAVIVDGERLLTAADLSSMPKVPSGAEIEEINGAPVSYLLSRMRQLIVKETQEGQDRKIQMEFAWLLSSLGLARGAYQVKYSFDGENITTEIDGILPPATGDKAGQPKSFYGFSVLSDKTALLWLNDFNEKPEVFEQFMQDKLALMERHNIGNLIIDIRYNSGGLSQNLKTLLAFISDKETHWAVKAKIKISEQLKQNHRSQTRHRREEKYSWGLQWLPVEWTNKLQHSIYWADNGEYLDLSLEPIESLRKKALKGVWVLTNGYCYSACSFFVASVNRDKSAITLGERVGSLVDVQFAYPVTLELPHSHLKVTLPTMELIFSDPNQASQDNRLILPLVPIKRTESDIQLKQDPVLKRALLEAESISNH
ncbi:S41 family peptidase [Aliikangiella sp. G2MR2-5]|uniref:S41 family peptidase n=1 Tax=Aliikangiella sp. G2MR2-5 TaxID=2788943 RepID=UPI0018AA7330|nr:S41 family peptidase [Aliikangiella sp. G2MR2-5]